jgi:hypothetical protein
LHRLFISRTGAEEQKPQHAADQKEDRGWWSLSSITELHLTLAMTGCNLGQWWECLLNCEYR